MIIKLINFLVFQLGWFVIAIYHNNLSAILGVMLAFINFTIIGLKKNVILRCVVVTILGTINDFIISLVGVIKFANTGLYMTWWMVAVWVLFASILPGCLLWINRLPLYAIALLGGIGGSFAYVSAEYLGAISYNLAYLPNYLFHFLNWIIIFPICMLIIDNRSLFKRF